MSLSTLLGGIFGAPSKSPAMPQAPGLPGATGATPPFLPPATVPGQAPNGQPAAAQPNPQAQNPMAQFTNPNTVMNNIAGGPQQQGTPLNSIIQALMGGTPPAPGTPGLLWNRRKPEGVSTLATQGPAGPRNPNPVNDYEEEDD